MPKDKQSNKRPRVPKRTWWPHDKVYEACKKAGLCALWHYDACTRGDHCSFKHSLLRHRILIDGVSYSAAEQRTGTQKPWPRSTVPPSHPAKKQKGDANEQKGISQLADPTDAPAPKQVTPTKPTVSSSSGSVATSSTRVMQRSERIIQRVSPQLSPLRQATAAVRIQQPASPRFTSCKQQMQKVDRELKRLTAIKAALADEAKGEEYTLNSPYTARCQRFEYLTRPTAQCERTNAYHVRYEAVPPHSLGYNDNKHDHRTHDQSRNHHRLHAELITALKDSHCFSCRHCSRSLSAVEEKGSSTIVACERCYAVVYCSLQCMQADGPSHAFQCYYHPGYCLRSEQADQGRPLPNAQHVCDTAYSVMRSQSSNSQQTSTSAVAAAAEARQQLSSQATPVAASSPERDMPYVDLASDSYATPPSPSAGKERFPVAHALIAFTGPPVRKEFPTYQESVAYIAHDLGWEYSVPDATPEDVSLVREALLTPEFASAKAMRATLLQLILQGPSLMRSAMMARGLAFGYLVEMPKGEAPSALRFEVSEEEGFSLRGHPAYHEACSPEQDKEDSEDEPGAQVAQDQAPVAVADTPASSAV